MPVFVPARSPSSGERPTTSNHQSTMKARASIRSLLLLAAASQLVTSATAATLYWDATPGTPNGASGGGAGTWDTATANWDNGSSYVTWDNANNDTAVFSGTAGTVTIDTVDNLGVTVGGLNFTVGSYTLAGAAAGEKLTFGTAGDINTTTGTTIISAVIAGSSTITKTGAGTLNLTAANTFTGDFEISAGTVTVGGNNTAATLGPANYAGDITNNGTLLFTNSTSQNLSGVISGSGNLQKGGSGTLTLSGANTYTGKTIIAATAAGGPTVSVASFNSVNSDGITPGIPSMISSSLGAPTTVANGTIQLGSGTNIRSCTLTYTGAGETTDRVMNVQFHRRPISS